MIRRIMLEAGLFKRIILHFISIMLFSLQNLFIIPYVSTSLNYRFLCGYFLPKISFCHCSFKIYHSLYVLFLQFPFEIYQFFYVLLSSKFLNF